MARQAYYVHGEEETPEQAEVVEAYSRRDAAELFIMRHDIGLVGDFEYAFVSDKKDGDYEKIRVDISREFKAR